LIAPECRDLVKKSFSKHNIGKEVSHPRLSPTPPTKVKRRKILSSDDAIQVIRGMDFRPMIKEPVRLMDERIFRQEPMGIKEDLLTLTLEE
jgi:hypothetical protein